MGLIFSWFQKIFSLPDYKIVLLGIDNVGKSTLVYTLLEHIHNLENLKLDEDETKHNRIPITMGFNCESVDYKNLHLVFYDIAGQAMTRQVWYHYMKDTDLFMYMIDLENKDRYVESINSLFAFIEDTDSEFPGLLLKIPIFIVLNKIDKYTKNDGELNFEKIHEQVDIFRKTLHDTNKEKYTQLISNRKIRFIITSALQGHFLKVLMTEIQRSLLGLGPGPSLKSFSNVDNNTNTSTTDNIKESAIV